MSRVTAYKTDNVHLEVEFYEDMPWVHCTVNKWTKGTKQTLQTAMEDLADLLHEQGYKTIFAYIPEHRQKNKKFVKLFGFVNGGNDVWYRREEWV